MFNVKKRYKLDNSATLRLSRDVKVHSVNGIPAKIAKPVAHKHSSSTDPASNSIGRGRTTERNLDSVLVADPPQDPMLLNSKLTTKPNDIQKVTLGIHAPGCFKESRPNLALKVLRLGYQDIGIQEHRFLRSITEADPHGNERLVRWRESFKFYGHLCIVLELLGPSLARFRLGDGKSGSKKGPTPLCVIRRVALDILSALVFLHAKLRLIHADIKPENVCEVESISSDACSTSPSWVDILTHGVKLIDLGNAILLKDVQLCCTTFDVQTPAYRAPEVLFGIRFDTVILALILSS